jgi:hypothetical protein
VLEELTEAPWGKQAVFRDLYGNLFDLLDRRRWMNTRAISVPVLFRRMTAQQALPPDGFAAGEAQAVMAHGKEAVGCSSARWALVRRRGDCPLAVGGSAGWGSLAAPCCHNKPFLPTGGDLGAIAKWMVPGG